jgi:transposase-like protein
MEAGRMFKRKIFSTEQIIMKLREADVLIGQGKSVREAVRALEISEQTYYRWRKEYGGLDTTQARKLKDLEKENARHVPRRGKVPRKQPKRGRLWLNDGCVIRLRPEFPNHVWGYDFVENRTHNGVKFRILPAPYRRYR